ncbi:hypothetical protein F4804DRAFT_326162 [Jackrogersella minutella]|nr:hypothetical protein F4804DRAFT_326162 [Jackrogersella minutella]
MLMYLFLVFSCTLIIIIFPVACCMSSASTPTSRIVRHTVSTDDTNKDSISSLSSNNSCRPIELPTHHNGPIHPSILSLP